MKKNIIKLGLIVSIVLAFASGAVATGAPKSRDALLSAMNERLPELMELKLSGKIGETNQALVEARTDLTDAEKRIVRDENTDRLAYYQGLAERLNVPVEAVQQKRAEQIRKDSPKNIWIQLPGGGEWSRK